MDNIANSEVAPRVALETLGCKLNQAETETLALRLSEAGLRLVGPEQAADVCVLNTCTVTHVADRKSRQMVRRARRSNPEALIVVTGCYAQQAFGKPDGIDGADVVVANEDKGRLPELVLQRCGQLMGAVKVDSCPGPPEAGHLRTRALVKIQDGCNQSCSYCIVPSVRGQERSLPPEQVTAEIVDRLERGYKEVTLTGTQIGSYEGGAGRGLAWLIEHILEQTRVGRLRLSSLQPQDVSSDLLRVWQDERLCRHLHLPLQSGSAGVLRRMRRRYTPVRYEEAVSALRRAAHGIAITADMIVGFPGETRQEFEESLAFCRRMEFAAMHIFPYSPRPGTAAAGMGGRVSEPEKRERVRRMLELARHAALSFRERTLGQIRPVLFEERSDEHWTGLTDHYVRVFAASEQSLGNRIVPVTLAANSANGILGVV
ncbi:MAG: tRNA (N(6)-L-threonylcarbamoyladenosine(37)-C(2))-methylthiotransferase MtaB [Dehalococcoidia bacterium]|nr:tRNA (N(6)-L-threonylcarbamoyladenosine(37)-C(2))-methylthiotransferase MtaB [Dehalococcoidia bacterium]